MKSDGTVVAVGSNEEGECDTQSWTDIVAISAGWDYTLGLKMDGTVVATGLHYMRQADVKDWKNIRILVK